MAGSGSAVLDNTNVTSLEMTIDYEGPFARSGVAGAAEAYLGQRFLTKHAYDRLLHTDSLVHELTGPDLDGLSPKMLSEAALQGDEPAREVLAWAGQKLGVLMGAIVNLLDIRKFVVGGGVSAAGDFILGPARQRLASMIEASPAPSMPTPRTTNCSPPRSTYCPPTF